MTENVKTLNKRTLLVGDLYCGAGGVTFGMKAAAEDLGIDLDMFAVNHWDVAIRTHSQNNPDVQHYCEDVLSLDPLKAVPGGYLDVLWASVECIFHSNARGGLPMSDQSRSSAWDLPKWMGKLDIGTVIVENVPEFRHWGPLGKNNRPIKSRRGETFRAWIAVLRSMGYTVGWQILNAADFGDPTSRKRLFVWARKGRMKLEWPEPTHFPADQVEAARALVPLAKPYRTAREIINWDKKGKSIYGRKKPLAPNTYRRILAGLIKYSGLTFFAGAPNSTEPWHILPITQPLNSIISDNSPALLHPWLVVLQNNRDGLSIEEPVGAILASGTHYGIADGCIVPVTHQGGDRN